MKKCLLSVAMLMAGMGAWAQDATETVDEYAMMELAVKANMEANFEGVGYPKQDAASRATLQECIQNAWENLTSVEAYNALEAALENFHADSNINLPEEGRAYRIKAFWNTDYTDGTGFSSAKHWSLTWDETTSSYIPKPNEEGEIFVCKKVGEQYFFVSDNGYYLGWEADEKERFTKTTYEVGQNFTLEKATLEVTSPGIKDIKDGLTINDLFGTFCLKANNNHYLMYDSNSDNPRYVSSWEGSKFYAHNAHTTFFTLTEVEYTTNQFTIKETSTLADSELCVATFYSPNYATKMPEGYKAYWAESVGSENVNLKELTDIPANTAVVVTGPVPAEETATVTVSLSTENPDKAIVASNKLFGYAAQTAVSETEYSGKTGADGTVYALAKGDADVEFSHYTGENFLAGKAYLNAADAAGARSLIFNFGGDTETAIESIQGAESADAVVYDLAGRRVQGAQKGLYIVNGKVVIK